MKNWILAMVCLWLPVFLWGQATLKGKVSDQDNRPLPGASIALPEAERQTVADEMGTFVFENLSPGSYILRASHVGFEEATGVATITEGVEAVFFQITLQEQTIQLEAVLVEATRAGKNAPFTHSTLGREALENQNLGMDIPFLLEATPSVVASSDAGAGIGYTGIRIRGSDPTRINVTLNGIPVNDAESHNVFWVDLPDLASSTEDVQIQRGVGASTNGAGAFGASIHLNTNRLHENPFAKIAASAGSFGTKKISASVGTGLLGKKNAEYPGAASGRNTEFSDSHSAPNSQNPQYLPPHTSYLIPHTSFEARFSRILSDGYIERASVDLSAMHLSGAFFGKNKSLKINVFAGKEVTYQAWNGVPAQFVNDDRLRRFNVSGTEKTGKPHDNEVDDYAQIHYQLFYNHQLSRAWNLGVAGHYTRGYGFFEQYKAKQNFDDYGLNICDTCCCAFDNNLIRRRWLDNHFFGGIFSANYRQERLEATFSAAAHRYLGDHFGEIIWTERGGLPQGTRYYSGTGDKLDANVFSKIRYELTPSLHGFLDLQLRQVTHDLEGTDNSQRDVTQAARFLFFNPKAGLSWQLNEAISCYASAAVAQREPNRDDFADSPPDAPPLPEQLLDGEAGLRVWGTKHQLELIFYHMSYRNQLVLTGNINDVGAPIRHNVPTSYRTGIELSGNVELTNKINFEGNATFSQNRIRNFTEFVDNWDSWSQETIAHGSTDIAFSPSLIAFGRGSYSPFFLKKDRQKFTLSLSGKYVGRQFIDNTSNENTALPGYFTTDFQARLLLKTITFEELSVNFMLLNWLDARYSSNAWTYRFQTSDGSVTADPFVRREGNNTYNMTGFFPQAGRHFLVGITLGW